MANGRVYTLSFTAVAVTAQQDFFEIAGPADAVTEILEIHLSQSSEVGDAMEEGLSLAFKSGSTSTGTGGTQGVVPVPLSLGDAAYGGACDINNTAKASGGTIVTHHVWNWNVRVPFDVIFTPEATKILSPSARCTLELMTTPADSITMSGYMVFKEIGG